MVSYDFLSFNLFSCVLLLFQPSEFDDSIANSDQLSLTLTYLSDQNLVGPNVHELNISLSSDQNRSHHDLKANLPSNINHNDNDNKPIALDRWSLEEIRRRNGANVFLTPGTRPDYQHKKAVRSVNLDCSLAPLWAG